MVQRLSRGRRGCPCADVERRVYLARDHEAGLPVTATVATAAAAVATTAINANAVTAARVTALAPDASLIILGERPDAAAKNLLHV